MDYSLLKTINISLRNFNPILPFYTNYFIENKEFTSVELSNYGSPFYFYASPFLMILIVFKNFFNLTNYDLTLTFISLLTFFNQFLFLKMKKRSFKVLSLSYFIGGLLTTYDTIFRVYVVLTKHSGSYDKILSYENLIRAVSASTSYLIGQEIVLKTGSYEINFIVYMIVQILSAISSFIMFRMEPDKPILKNTSIVKSFFSMNKTTIMAFSSGCITSCYSIFIRMFLQNILREKTLKINSNNDEKLIKNKIIIAQEIKNEKNLNDNKILKSVVDNNNEELKDIFSNISKSENQESTNLGEESDNIKNNHINKTTDQNIITDNNKNFENISKKNSENNRKIDSELSNNIKLLVIQLGFEKIIKAPFKCVANFFIKIICIFFPKYSENLNIKNLKNPIKSGYWDAFINVLCGLSCYMITKYTIQKYKNIIYIIFLIITSLFVLLMTVSKSRILIYLLFFIINVLSRTSTNYTRDLINNKDIVIASFVVESFLHVSINTICACNEVNSLFKARIYGFLGVVVFIFIIITKLIDNYN